jgi:hypothetical protein
VAEQVVVGEPLVSSVLMEEEEELAGALGRCFPQMLRDQGLRSRYCLPAEVAEIS